MRKNMVREVTHTVVKLAKMEIVDGQPKAVTLPDEILLGNVSIEKAQRQMRKKHGNDVTVFSVHPNTKKYRMSVEKFIEVAEEVTDDEE